MKKNLQKNPEFIRYLNNKFPTFTRPLFWCSIGVLSIGSLAVYQYWQHPEWLQTTTENPERTSNLGFSNVPSEQLAEAANIDNLDLLMKEIDQNRTLSGISQQNKAKETAQLKREESQFSRIQQQQAAASNPTTNPSTTSADETTANPYTVGTLATGNQKVQDLIKSPSLSRYGKPNSSYSSLTQGKNDGSESIIPEPIGNSYLSNRNRLQPTTSRLQLAPSGVSRSVDSPATESSPEGNSATPQTPDSSGLATPTQEQPPSNIATPNRFVPSAAFGSRTTATSPSLDPTVGANSNPTNSYSNLYSSPYGTNSTGASLTNPGAIAPTSQGTSGYGVGLSSVNPNASATSGLTPGINSGLNSVAREGFGSAGSADPTSLQNNFRSSSQIGSSYTRSAPSGYQLQPQSLPSRVGARQSFGVDAANGTPANTAAPVNAVPRVNAPVTQPVGTPVLQPSGFFSTGELQP